MKASIKNYRQSPRKVRLVASLLKGKTVSSAKEELSFLQKRASAPILKLLNSAIANAVKNFGEDEKTLVIKDRRVDKGLVMKRFMPRAFGMAKRINKRTSHILITLEKREKVDKIKKTKVFKKLVASS